MYIDDCLDGTRTLMASDVREPINIGSDELVTINQLVDIVEEIAGVQLKRRYNLDAPKGVRGRSSDNTLIKQKLGWAPSIRLRDGMEKTYRWIYDQMAAPATTAASTPDRADAMTTLSPSRLAQLNPTVGDIAGNLREDSRARSRARRAAATCSSAASSR